jgi:nitrate reductase assembly molybdenum cofactor insertion protein NarJ
METILHTFADLLMYPTRESRAALAALEASLFDAHPMASRYLGRFAQGIESLTDAAWEELYTRTFDITAQCPLYLGIHLFGPENHKRPQLMTGLADVYRREGSHTDVELPDHLAVVLRHRGAFSEREWDDLVELCIARSLETMIAELSRGDNIYKYVLAALQHTVRAARGAAIHV